MPDHHYLFVDGGYLRARHSEAIGRVFGDSGRVDLTSMRTSMRSLSSGSLFNRIFYYDCLHDIPLVNESEDELRERVKSQQGFFDELQALEGFHVRLGSLSGSSRKLRQKEVDILLAVDALDHAFRKNMAGITLIAGDLDFAPLVEALVRLGTWVEIWYDPTSIAKHLREGADKAVPLTLDNYYAWCRSDFRLTHLLPQRRDNVRAEDFAFELQKSGSFENKEIRMYRHGSEHVLFIPETKGSWMFAHPDATVLENYFTVVFSPITWK